MGILKGLALKLLLDDRIFKEVRLSDKNLSTKLTILVPVHNQDKIIFDHLRSYIQNLSEPAELIIINDCSKDRSGEEIERFLDFLSSSDALISFRYFKTRMPLFETRCDDFGIRLAKSPYVIEIQADMKILHKSYDSTLIQLMEQSSDLAMISCRGVHSFSDLKGGELATRGRELGDKIDWNVKRLYYLMAKVRRKFIDAGFHSSKMKVPTNSDFSPIEHRAGSLTDWNEIFPNERSQQAGFLSEKIQLLPYRYEVGFMNFLESYVGQIWEGQTVMRGPLIINRRAYVDNGGFSLKALFQGGDDHELAFRLRNRGFKVAFSPIYFSSPPHLRTVNKRKAVHKKLWSHFNAYLRHDNLFDLEFFRLITKN